MIANKEITQPYSYILTGLVGMYVLFVNVTVIGDRNKIIESTRVSVDLIRKRIKKKPNRETPKTK